MTLLEVDDLTVRFPTDDGLVTAVTGLSFRVEPGQTLGIVGESGSGKSITSMAVLGILPRRARVTGSIRFQGRELLGLSEGQLRPLRGNRIAMVFQDALTALNPVRTVGEQIAEAIRVHDARPRRAELRRRSVELLDVVGIPSPATRAGQYPHELSGGMRQRVMIAMSIANEPELLIADEPTTALDVTVQAQIMDVIERIQDRTDAAILLITHDLGVVAGVADRVLVMYAGAKVEEGPVEPIFYETAHPYTQGLLASLPRLDRRERGELYRIPGQPPSPRHRPEGCAFHPRCRHAQPGRCDTGVPVPSAVGAAHTAACLRLGEFEGAGA
ncbi:ABC transporter ATP-binding protein [Amycolatopsis saalfeldensis]|uniref:Peptide/nickel transport system ATP-binding protein n=1 Tax=Amycolatopsis saalfeldensis TaxID=394193 RepID=A0A1H8YLR5_9PSEU|nr:ABC transporter ATP-binding protein [Amycolatopsis saalfeldensis]SEP53125.1 peptide/nickel transport system ATP-binding protein [Amycolatopsis saalfeldensis]